MPLDPARFRKASPEGIDRFRPPARPQGTRPPRLPRLVILVAVSLAVGGAVYAIEAWRQTLTAPIQVLGVTIPPNTAGQGTEEDRKATARGGTKDASPDRGLLAKTDTLAAECLVYAGDWALQSRDRYLSWCARDAGPTGKERNLYGLYAMGNRAQACADAVKKWRAAPPALPEVEAAADAFVRTLMPVDALIARAYRYYEAKDYLDDGMAGGREMHPQLMAGWDATDAARTRLEETLRQAATPALEREAARADQAANDGMGLSWKLLLAARLLASQVDVPAGTDVDRTRFGLALDRLSAAADAWEAFRRADPEAAGKVPGDSWLLDPARRLVQKAKEVRRAWKAEDEAGLAAPDADRGVDGRARNRRHADGPGAVKQEFDDGLARAWRERLAGR